MVEKYKCKICGFRFYTNKLDRYTVGDNGGLVQSLANGNKKYDAFDCPLCGCQTVVGERLDRVEDKQCRISET